MARFLLDANALIALRWSNHAHHKAALSWFKGHAAHSWAPVRAQSAFVRVILQPAFSSSAMQLGEVIELLALNTAHAKHHYLNVDFDMRRVQTACTGGLLGHRQITDAWLLATAIRHKAKLVTFDTGITSLLATPAERAAHLALLKN